MRPMSMPSAAVMATTIGPVEAHASDAASTLRGVFGAIIGKTMIHAHSHGMPAEAVVKNLEGYEPVPELRDGDPERSGDLKEQADVEQPLGREARPARESEDHQAQDDRIRRQRCSGYERTRSPGP